MSQASEVIFGDAWLFRAPRTAEPDELLAMLGQPETHGFELALSNWDSPEACARELAKPLGVAAEALLLSASDAGDDDNQSGSGEGAGGSMESEEGIAWPAATAAMLGLSEQIVLIVRCHEGGGTQQRRPGGAIPREASGESVGLNLLGRLVGCVANSHITSQVRSAQRAETGGASRASMRWARPSFCWRPLLFACAPLLNMPPPCSKRAHAHLRR